MEQYTIYLPLVSTLTDDTVVADKYAAHLGELFSVIDPAKISRAYADAVVRQDAFAMLQECASYYRNKPAFPTEGLSAAGSYDHTVADHASRGIMREVNIDWTFEGEIDFFFDPTALQGSRNHEWLWQFNRHSYWIAMARAFRDTGDERYALAFRTQLLRWIAQTDAPAVNWNGPGSAWRTIECGLRLLRSWQVAFDGFCKHLDDATLLLMIASMHRQAKHLVANPTRGNWLMMESNGVYTFSALFPELSDAADHRKIATERLLREMELQILPDGMHNELSPDYQLVVCHCAINFYELSDALGLSAEIPQSFTDLIHKTVRAAIQLSTPALTQPRTNDTYTIQTRRFTDRAAWIAGATEAYRYINSARTEGQPPAGETASAYFPYAGFAVMRSDWSADATYLCFDVGPLGAGHMHQDKLNVILYRGADELIYDDGGGQYESSAARGYAVSAYGHNTVLVDGMAQHRGGPLIVNAPIDAAWVTTPMYDYATGTYEDGFRGTGMRDSIQVAAHRREVRFCKPNFFLVRDTLTSTDNNVHDYELLWHLNTTSVQNIPMLPGAVLSAFGGHSEIAIVPMDSADGTTVVCGQTEPQLRGWYNGRNDQSLHSASTVSRIAHGVREFCFLTLLFPLAAGEVPPTVVQQDGMISVEFRGRRYCVRPDALDRPDGVTEDLSV